MPLRPGRARCVPVGAGSPGERRPFWVIRRDTLSCKNTGQRSYALSLLSSRSRYSPVVSDRNHIVISVEDVAALSNGLRAAILNKLFNYCAVVLNLRVIDLGTSIISDRPNTQVR
jgi:hypothetical protein